MRFRCRSSSISTSPPQLQTALACCCCHLGASYSSNCTATAEKARERAVCACTKMEKETKMRKKQQHFSARVTPPEVPQKLVKQTSDVAFKAFFFCCCFQPLSFCHVFIDHTTPRSQVQQSAVSLKIYQFTRCVSKSIPGYHLGYKPSNSCGDELRWVNVLGSHLKEFMDTISHQQEPVQKVRRFKNMRRQSL